MCKSNSKRAVPAPYASRGTLLASVNRQLDSGLGLSGVTGMSGLKVYLYFQSTLTPPTVSVNSCELDVLRWIFPVWCSPASKPGNLRAVRKAAFFHPWSSLWPVIRHGSNTSTPPFAPTKFRVILLVLLWIDSQRASAMEWVTLSTKKSTSIAKLARTPTRSSSLLGRGKRSFVNVLECAVKVLGSAAGADSLNGIVPVQTVALCATAN